MKIVNIFFVSGKHMALNVDEREREELVYWLENKQDSKKYTIKQNLQTGAITYTIYKDNIEYAAY